MRQVSGFRRTAASRSKLVTTGVLLLLGHIAYSDEPPQPLVPTEQRTAEQRAAEYLVAAVLRWPEDEHCFACHHHGDGARAVYRARKFGLITTATPALDQWLAGPEQWNLPDASDPTSDQKLADLQFALGLRAALEEGSVTDREALRTAAGRVVRHFTDEGAWPADPTSALGSPVTYGAHLGTAMARQVLAAADPARFRQPLARSRAWLLREPPTSIPAAAAVILGLSASERLEAPDGVLRAAKLLTDAQHSGGGWGSYPGSRPETFDTALALLALAELQRTPGQVGNQFPLEQSIARGRAALLDQQEGQGGWRETTRPAGRTSYAQHISTTAWATLALLETRAAGRTSEPDRR